MSVNTTLRRDFLVDVDGFRVLMADQLGRWNSASTLEDRLAIEEHLVETFKELLNFTYQFDPTRSVDHPDINNFSKEERALVDSLKINTARLDALARNYLKYYNTMTLKLSEAIGARRRSLQKLAVLNRWDRDESKFVFSENFYTYDTLAINFTSVPPCYISTTGAFITLPVLEHKAIQPVNAGLSRGNGVPGNSEYGEIGTNNLSPTFCFDQKADTWFEYERLDSGPLSVSIRADFGSESIINALKIEGINLADSMNYIVEDVLFNKTSGRSVSIKDLMLPNLRDDFFEVKTIGSGIQWEASFMPVKCITATVILKQDHFYKIPVRNNEGDVFDRDRYAIGVKNITFLRRKYGAKGGLNSTPYLTPPKLYAAAAVVNIFPRNTNLFDFDLGISLDNGDNWEKNIFDPSEVQGKTLLCTGDPMALVWNTSFTRNDRAFADAISFSDEEPKIEADSMLRSVTASSPQYFQLKEKPYNKEVFVLQPKVAKKSRLFSDAIELGAIGVENKIVLRLPASLEELGASPEELRIFVNGDLWNVLPGGVEELESIVDPDIAGGAVENGWGVCALGADHREIIFVHAGIVEAGVAMKNTVSFLLDEERLLFERRSDGFYSRFSTIFDPDERNINITYLPSGMKSKSLIIRGPNKRYKLGVKYIQTLDFTAADDEGLLDPAAVAAQNVIEVEGDQLVWFAKSLYALLEADVPPAPLGGSNIYYIDGVNGILYTKLAVTTGTNQIRYKHYDPVRLSSDDFDVWYDGITPMGVVINPRSFSAEEIVDNLSVGPQRRLNALSGLMEKKNDIFVGDTNAYELTYDYLIKGSVRVRPEAFGKVDGEDAAPREVEFIDGKTEFLGLLPMDNEYTAKISADGAGIVTLKLAVGASWYEDLGINFSNITAFEKKVLVPDAVGEYSIDLDGQIRVFVGVDGSIPEGIQISYWYLNPVIDTKDRFSVDYKNGILYLSDTLDPITNELVAPPVAGENALVNYKVANYVAGYSVGIEAEDYEYNPVTNTVQLFTENWKSHINRLVKIVWGRPPAEDNLLTLKDYFSPIVNSIGFKFY